MSRPIKCTVLSLGIGFGLWAVLVLLTRRYEDRADHAARAFDHFTGLPFPGAFTPQITVDLPRVAISNPIPATIRLGNHRQWVREMAICTDESGRQRLVWRPFKTDVELNLGDLQGQRTVRFAFRYHWNYQPFQFPVSRNITVATRPLEVAFVSPQTHVLTQPVLQLVGYSCRPLVQWNYHLIRPDSIAMDGQGFPITAPDLAAAPAMPEQHWFQFFDLQLQPGTNELQLQFKDDYGRFCKTNLVWVYNTERATNQPALRLDWPPDGATIAAAAFTARAHTDNPGVQVLAHITGDGRTVKRNGVVGRNGEVWVDDVPVLGQTNLLRLTAIDPAGNATQSRATFFKSSVRIGIDAFDHNLLRNPTIRLTGTVSEEHYAVRVNGVRAQVDGKRWSAEGVPVSPGGVAEFRLQADPLDDHKP